MATWRLPCACACALAQAGCPKDAPAPRTAIENTAAGPSECRERMLGKVTAEAVSVAATADRAVWLDYNFGSLTTRPLAGGDAVKLVAWPREHNSEDLLVHDGWAYWTSKAEAAVFRASLTGGAPEKLVPLTTDDLPVGIANVGDTIYAATFSGKVVWWRDGAHGVTSIVSGAAESALAGTEDTLYVGTLAGVVRLRGPDSRAELASGLAKATAVAVAVTPRMVYWIGDVGSGPTIFRFDRASEVEVPITDGEAGTVHALVAGHGGAYLVDYASARVRWLGDTAAAPVVVATAPGNVVDLAPAGDALVVGTADGVVQLLCPVRD